MTSTLPLDPELAGLAVAIPALDFSNGPGELRALFDKMLVELAPPLSPGVERVDHIVSRDPEIVVRVHRPQHLTSPAACLYSIHGGGYVIGSYAMDDTVFDRYCVDFGCVGVAVEYRLAPETPYPGPLEDCYRGLAWTFAHSEELGIDPNRIGIRGESAGGGLAVGLALLARDRAEVDIALRSSSARCSTTAKSHRRVSATTC